MTGGALNEAVARLKISKSLHGQTLRTGVRLSAMVTLQARVKTQKIDTLTFGVEKSQWATQSGSHGILKRSKLFRKF